MKQPLAEVFGFPPGNLSAHAMRYRKNKLCPFNNRVPNCTKDKADNPLGVCSILGSESIAITCPVRFREEWLIAEDAAAFFFPEGDDWTSLSEVRLHEKNGKVAGNIDVVLVSYDKAGRLLTFGALEVQGVYISGNIRRPFEHYMKDPVSGALMDWRGQANYPRPDYLSSSRKRLAPQLMFKGGILNAWEKKIAVALDRGFFETLPKMNSVDPDTADIAWLVYDLELRENRYCLSRHKIVYTTFETSLGQITRPEVGDQAKFVQELQSKLDEKLESENAPETGVFEVTRFEP